MRHGVSAGDQNGIVNHCFSKVIYIFIYIMLYRSIPTHFKRWRIYIYIYESTMSCIQY